MMTIYTEKNPTVYLPLRDTAIPISPYEQHLESLSRNQEVEIEIYSWSGNNSLTAFHLKFIRSCLWTDYAPMAQLLKAWELAAPLSYLHQAIGYQHIVAGLEPSARAEFRNAVPYYVRQALQAMTPRHLAS